MTPNDMIRLRLLGVPAVDGAGAASANVLSQPKRLALLAFLALRPGWVRREELVETFWPDRMDERGRRSLSQALHFIKASLGPDIIRARGVGEIRLSRDGVSCDVWEFEDALRRRHWQDAVPIYNGEFLQGINVEPSSGFSHWLESERMRLQRQAGEAAEKMARIAFSAGDLPAAIRWQRLAVDIRPLEESTVREYMILLDEAGEGAEALRAYETFRQRLGDGYDLDPARETVRIVTLIRSRRPESEALPAAVDAGRPETSALASPAAVGPMAAGEVAESSDGAEAAGGAGGSHISVRRDTAGGWRRAWATGRRRVLLAAVMVAVAATMVTFDSVRTLGYTRGDAPPPVYDPNHVAVMYFEVRGDETGKLAEKADYIAELAIDRLSHIDTLNVISSTGVRRFRREHPPLDTVVRALKVGTVVTASIQESNGATSIILNIEDGRSDSSLRSETLVFRTADMFEMADSFAAVISRNLRVNIGEQFEIRRLAESSSPEAGSLMAEASELDRAFDTYALAGFETLRGVYWKAEKLLVRAQRLDPEWAEPALLRSKLAWSMGFLCIARYECDSEPWLRGALAHATRALAIDPTSERTHESLARAMYQLWLTGYESDRNILDKALAEAQTAIRIDRKHAPAWKTLSNINYELGNLAEARAYALTALDEDAFLRDRNEIQWRVFESSFELGRDADAEMDCANIRGSGIDFMGVMCELMLQGWSTARVPDARATQATLAAFRSTFAGAAAGDLGATIEMLASSALIRAGEPAAALKLMAHARVRASSDEYLIYEAAALKKLGRTEEARSSMTEYVRSNPGARGRQTMSRILGADSDEAYDPRLYQASIPEASVER